MVADFFGVDFLAIVFFGVDFLAVVFFVAGFLSVVFFGDALAFVSALGAIFTPVFTPDATAASFNAFSRALFLRCFFATRLCFLFIFFPFNS